jgi:integrase/recombinase XerD
MTPLRQRFLDDLRIRNYAPKTIEAYVTAVARFARHFGRSPDTLGAEDVRTFQLHLLEQHTSWSQFNQIVCGLRLFYALTLQRPDVVRLIPYGKKPRTLPCVLSPEEVLRLFQAARPGRDRVLLQTAYACGLRLGELLSLRLGDVDSARMVLHVRQGKGRKDRLVPLSPRLLEELRGYWRQYRPRDLLFPGMSPGQPLCDAAVQRMCQRTVARAELGKRATLHTLRHSFATHMLEAGIDLVTLQRLLGHNSLQTTAHYLHVSTQRLQQTPRLLDLLALPRPTTTEGQP